MPARKTDSGEEGFFSVVAITCFPGGDFKRTIQVNFLQRSTAYEYCDKLQDEIDADCQPARAYVFDEEGIPIRAARASHSPANYFFQANERPKRYERRPS